MNPESLGYIVGTVVGIALCIGLLVLTVKLMKSLARTVKPLAVIVGLLAVGLIGLQFAQQKLDARQKDQIEKFFDSLVDQARGAFTSSEQADEPASSSTPAGTSPSTTEQSGPVIMTGELPCELCNPRIDISTCVKEW